MTSPIEELHRRVEALHKDGELMEKMDSTIEELHRRVRDLHKDGELMLYPIPVNTYAYDNERVFWNYGKVGREPLPLRFGEVLSLGWEELMFSTLKSKTPIYETPKELCIDCVLSHVAGLQNPNPLKIYFETVNEEREREKMIFNLDPEVSLTFFELRKFVFNFLDFYWRRFEEFFVLPPHFDYFDYADRILTLYTYVYSEAKYSIFHLTPTNVELGYPFIRIGISLPIKIDRMSSRIIDFGFVLSVDERLKSLGHIHIHHQPPQQNE